MGQKKAIVIGAGIVGLAAARALALKGYAVEVLEKNARAYGASVRNFGMVWPIGQPAGHLYERACRSRDIWREICTAAGIWHSEQGSVHVAHAWDEMQVITEFVAQNGNARPCRLLTAAEALALSPAINPEGLKGGFFSPDELIVDPREAIAKLPAYLEQQLGVRFHFSAPATEIAYPAVYSGNKCFEADRIFICSGQEFESLYPELYLNSPLTKCKLQMMRTVPQPADFRIGPAICGGLTLTHYGAFRSCATLPQLQARIEEQYPEYVKWGIHVMISQNGSNEIVIGDSHEYGPAHDPFDRKEINDLILDYLDGIVRMPDRTIGQSWNGTYVKMKEGTELVLHPQEGITIVNGLGGAGMTLSFGLLEELVMS
jgi:FAD dependent oxidoreductase TIGR03364